MRQNGLSHARLREWTLLADGGAAPLRERRADIPLLIAHFVAKYNAELNTHCPRFDPEAVQALCDYPWRGNVRELENVVERALIFADGHPVALRDLAFVAGPISDSDVASLNLRDAAREFERQHVLKVLATFGNNKAEAAQALGIGLSSLYRKLEELGVVKSSATETSAS